MPFSLHSLAFFMSARMTRASKKRKGAFKGQRRAPFFALFPTPLPLPCLRPRFRSLAAGFRAALILCNCAPRALVGLLLSSRFVLDEWAPQTGPLCSPDRESHGCAALEAGGRGQECACPSLLQRCSLMHSHSHSHLLFTPPLPPLLLVRIGFCVACVACNHQLDCLHRPLRMERHRIQCGETREPGSPRSAPARPTEPGTANGTNVAPAALQEGEASESKSLGRLLTILVTYPDGPGQVHFSHRSSPNKRPSLLCDNHE